jgi:glutamate---cysteine ligase / carboxylate-amine ligase
MRGMTGDAPPSLTPEELRAAFARHDSPTVGLEEELMVLHPRTLDLHPVAGALADAADDPRIVTEMPAAQLELVAPPRATVPDALAELAAARRSAMSLARDRARLAGAGTHPFAAPMGPLTPGPHYAATEAEFGEIAHRQLVFGLHVHVAVPPCDALVPVHDALRGYLPDIAALAANAPFHDGRDTGLASVRPKIAEALPRQGVPPPIGSWARLAGELRWGAESGAVADPGRWWWELRLNPRVGTIELRVADTQTTVAEAGAVAALAHALVGWLVERHEAGEPLPCPPGWRIDENRWWACRDGPRARLADLRTGARTAVVARIDELVDRLLPVARRLGCQDELAGVRGLARRGGAARQREVAAEHGLAGLAAWLADRFPAGCEG